MPSEKANHGLLAGVTADSLALAELAKGEGIDTDTLQEFYAQGLIGFYDYASTHYHVGKQYLYVRQVFKRR